MEDDNKPDCYWLDIGELYIESCQGTCDDDRWYNQFNQTFELDLILQYEDDYNDANRTSTITNTTGSFTACDRYFGTINDTDESLSSVDAVFYNVLQLISGPGELLHEIIYSPFSKLSGTNLLYVTCTNEPTNIIPIITEVTVSSASSNQQEIDAVFESDGEFITTSQELLSKLFGIPVRFERVIPPSVINEGIRWEWILIISIASSLVAICLVIIIIKWGRSIYRRRKSIFVKNPMVLSIGIGLYDNDMATKDKEYKGHARDLDLGVRKDINNSINLFQNVFKYDICPDEYQNKI